MKMIKVYSLGVIKKVLKGWDFEEEELEAFEEDLKREVESDTM